MPGECLVERDAWLVLLEQLDDVGVTEFRYPGAIVEGLCGDIAGCPVPLQLEDVDYALGIDCEQVDESAMGSWHLAADEQQRLAEDRWIVLDVFLKLRFECYTAWRQTGQAMLVRAPESTSKVISQAWLLSTVSANLQLWAESSSIHLSCNANEAFDGLRGC